MVFLGDVDVPILSEVNTDLISETSDKDFVDEPPRSYNLYSNLEAGTYTFLLTPKLHSRGESFEEQRDSILALVERHGSEFPIDYRSESGFLVANKISYFESPSELIDEVEVDIRYMPYSKYKSAIVANAENYSQDFSVTEESFFGIDSEVVVYKNGSIETAYTNLNTADGDVSYYTYSDDTLSLEIDPFESEFERTALCRLFSNGRIYSTRKSISDFELNNSIIKSSFAQNNSVISAYDSQWKEIATIPFQHSDGYVEENTNDVIDCHSTTGESVSIYRSIPTIQYNIDSRTSFDVEFSTDSVVEQNSHYIAVDDPDGNTVLIVKGSDIGDSFTVNSGSVSVENLNNSEATFFVGFVPDEFTVEEVVRMCYSRGSTRRTFINND